MFRKHNENIVQGIIGAWNTRLDKYMQYCNGIHEERSMNGHGKHSTSAKLMI